jgi:alpha-tubulin suppressor-like RCC1 family protein
MSGTGGVPGAGGLPATGGGTGTFCSTNRDCPPPHVCNLNTDLRCGPAIYTQVDVANENTCAVVSDGTLRCWGSNRNGQLKLASTENQLVPVPIPDLANVRMVATGWLFNCVLLRDGQVACWGYNYNGTLGCPAPATSGGSLSCTPYPSGSKVEQIMAGAELACAILSDGTMQCWGRNHRYQVGDGTNATAFNPMTVSGLADVRAAKIGLWQTCAVIGDGTARCWGANDRGQLGNGTYTDGPKLTAASGIDGSTSRVTAVAPGEDHSCFLLDGGAVRCTGDNTYGQLGDGGSTRSAAPVLASQLTQSTRAIAVGIGMTCAWDGNRTLRCLGAGSSGQLGSGTSAPSRTPVTVELPAGVSIVSVAAKYGHVCALSADGRIWCWGTNGVGQLGNGTQTNSSVPVQVPAPTAG